MTHTDHRRRNQPKRTILALVIAPRPERGHPSGTVILAQSLRNPVKRDDVKRDGEPGPPASTARWGDRDFTDLLSLGFPVISPLYGMGHE